MKTALQEVFNKLEELHPSLFDIHTEQGRTFINEFHKYLEMEKEQIIDAYNAQKIGLFAMTETGIVDTANKTAEQYYNETFKSELITNIDLSDKDKEQIDEFVKKASDNLSRNI